MQQVVTPCVGVWIETGHRSYLDILPGSHPAWVCGLKQRTDSQHKGNGKSHPAWVCGLKHFSGTLGDVPVVTPCVGVWIETTKIS